MAYYNPIEHLPQQELSNATSEIDDTHPDIPQFPSLCVYTNCNKMAVSHFYNILTHCMGYTWPECTGLFRLPPVFNANTNDMTLEDVGITDGFRIEIRILRSANEVEQAPQRVEPDQVPEVQPTTTQASEQQPALAAKPKKTPKNNSQSAPLRRSKRIRMKERVNYAEYDDNDF
ncbi:uncharacterized protein LOC126266516 [Aethina tumida]|uniref:uncharacterized protein LOC126266516 n=1 Tax=Aethina tumida TaxID=116153 RepID=UPI0021475925|nr:uncharacterized protein LOC126266516 [Aethina tumida]